MFVVFVFFARLGRNSQAGRPARAKTAASQKSCMAIFVEQFNVCVFVNQVGEQTTMCIYIYIYIYTYVCIYVYKCPYSCLLDDSRSPRQLFPWSLLGSYGYSTQ